MSQPQPLEVKVIYSASSRGRRRAPSVRAPGPKRSSPRSGRSAGLLLLALMNLAGAGGLHYWSWWKVDKEIYFQLALKAEIPMTAISGQTPAAGGSAKDAFSVTAPAAANTPLVSKRQMVLVGSAYGWLTLATLAALALAMSGATLLVRSLGDWLRWPGIALLVLGTCASGWLALDIVGELGWQFTNTQWRQAMAALVVLAGLLGLSIGRWHRGFTKLSAALLILLGIGSAGGLYLLSRFDGVPPEQAAPTFLAIAFAVHAAYGIILLPIASRIPRSR